MLLQGGGLGGGQLPLVDGEQLRVLTQQGPLLSDSTLLVLLGEKVGFGATDVEGGVIHEDVVVPVTVDAGDGSKGLGAAVVLPLVLVLAKGEQQGDDCRLSPGLLDRPHHIELVLLAPDRVHVDIHVEEGGQYCDDGFAVVLLWLTYESARFTDDLLPALSKGRNLIVAKQALGYRPAYNTTVLEQ